ncbi:unnamed protein product [Linum trigynum]|uniref:Uncharacterized protein n=1 Tax=Linum trigynum TaxID=586398 RepID=A0AAV2E337_9ROSI
MRGALSPLLLLYSLLERWISRAAVAVFESSWRNQNKEDWYKESSPACTQAMGMDEILIKNEIGGRLLAVASLMPEKASRGVEWRRARQCCLRKRTRLFASAELGFPEERPLKRLRHKQKNQWRFWLPSSSELDGEEPVLAPLAGSNTQKTEVRIEHPAPCENPAPSTPFGEGICPAKSKRGRTEDWNTPLGDLAPCVSPSNWKSTIQASPSIPSAVDVKRDDKSGVADLRRRLVWPRKIKTVKIGSAPEIPVLLNGILGQILRVKNQKNSPCQRSPIPSANLIADSHCGSRLLLGLTGPLPYKIAQLNANRPLCSDRCWVLSPEAKLVATPSQQWPVPEFASGKGTRSLPSSARVVARGVPSLGNFLSPSQVPGMLPPMSVAGSAIPAASSSLVSVARGTFSLGHFNFNSNNTRLLPPVSITESAIPLVSTTLVNNGSSFIPLGLLRPIPVIEKTLPMASNALSLHAC